MGARDHRLAAHWEALAVQGRGPAGYDLPRFLCRSHSLQDAVADVGCVRRLEGAGGLEAKASAELTEQRAARAEDDGRDVDAEFVAQTGAQCLLRDAGTAADADVPVAGN